MQGKSKEQHAVIDAPHVYLYRLCQTYKKVWIELIKIKMRGINDRMWQGTILVFDFRWTASDFIDEGRNSELAEMMDYIVGCRICIWYYWDSDGS